MLLIYPAENTLYSCRKKHNERDCSFSIDLGMKIIYYILFLLAFYWILLAIGLCVL